MTHTRKKDMAEAPLHIVLVAPEIAGNTGNVIRLCANVGATLHLVEPLGFDFDDRKLRRAGLDYHDLANIRVHTDWRSCREHLPDGRIFAFTSRATIRYCDTPYRAGDALVFGAEASGLSAAVLADFADEHLRTIPMRPGNRSINLANAVALVAYDAWRQFGFDGAGTSGVVSTVDAASGDPTFA